MTAQVLDAIRKVAIVGGNGTMGSGLMSMIALAQLEQQYKTGERFTKWQTRLVDLPETERRMPLTLERVERSARSWAKRHADWLYEVFANDASIKDNGTLKDRVGRDVRRLITTSTSLVGTEDATMFIDASFEDPDVKIPLLREMQKRNPSAPKVVISSSIPTRLLDERAGLEGNIINLHVFSPPERNSFLEFVEYGGTLTDVVTLGDGLAELWRKKVVKVRDEAGFGGNAEYMREILLGEQLVKGLKDQGKSEAEALFRVDFITRNYLMRPFGIFGLNDLVGLKTCQNIMRIITQYGQLLTEELHSNHIDNYLEAGLEGGVRGKGLFTYDHDGNQTGIYDLEQGRYVMFEETDWHAAALAELKDEMPLMDSEDIPASMNRLDATRNQSTDLAKKFLIGAANIVDKLVNASIVGSPAEYDKGVRDMTNMLKWGFAHKYGPNEYSALLGGGE